MAIDRAHLGYALPPFTVTIAADRIANFCTAIGDTTTPNGVAPPTFMKAIEGENNSSRRIIEALGIDLKRVLHAEQQFDYLGEIRSGDTVEVVRKVTEIYDKKGGQLEFVTIESTISEATRGLLGRSRQLVLVRHPAPKVAA